MARNYKSEYENYHSKPKQKKNRATRNAARKKMQAAGKVSKGDGKDVHHPLPLAKGGDNNQKLVVKKKGANRSVPRTKTARMK